MTPMTTKKRFCLALTVLLFVAVTGFVIGCDSDDTPTVTPPSGGGGATATRNTTAETQGREGLEATDNGTMIRNTGEVALNVRFAYDEPRHYRLNVNTAMPSDPASAGSAPTRVACGVPATGRANGQCFNNDRSEIQSAPTPYEASGNGNGDNGGENGDGDNGGNGDNGGGSGALDPHRKPKAFPSQKATHCFTSSGRSFTNNCGTAVVFTAPICGDSELDYEILSAWDSLEDMRAGRAVTSPKALYSGAPIEFKAGETFEFACTNPGYQACYLREKMNSRSGGYNRAYVPGFDTTNPNGPWSCYIGSI